MVRPRESYNPGILESDWKDTWRERRRLPVNIHQGADRGGRTGVGGAPAGPGTPTQLSTLCIDSRRKEEEEEEEEEKEEEEAEEEEENHLVFAYWKVKQNNTE